VVLVDGVPANDPFGGWVYWRALPRLGVERVEVVPGGGSALYGSAALGGVVALIPRPLDAPSLEADASYGSFNTVLLAARGAQRWERVGAALEGEWLRSDGYPVVAPSDRGPVDGDAPSMHGTLQGRLEARPTRRLKLTTTVGVFHERQNGGTPLTDAEVNLGHAAMRAQQRAGGAGDFVLTLFGRLQRFEQTRARFSEGRTSEQLAARQDVPAGDAGGALLWHGPTLRWLGTHRLVAGVDGRHVAGTSQERLFPPMASDAALVRREAGGRQWLLGAFVEDLYAPTSWLQVDAALRIDTWRNTAGRLERRRGDGSLAVEHFAARQEHAFTPRVGLLLQPLEAWLLRGAVYRSFRAPTLNELYRPFQVGTILTAANPALGPETLTGFEGGTELRVGELMNLRATAFWNRLEDPVTNRTLPEPLPDGSQRQRQNLGRAKVRGLELALTAAWAARLSAMLAYTLVDARVDVAAAGSGLVGKRLAQDPVHRGSLLVVFHDPALFSATLQARIIGAQYEDDQNTLRMKAFGLLDLLVSRRLFWRLELFASAENLTNTRYLVGRAGVDTIGAPLFVRGGLMLRDEVP
jgi:outer membrane receptor protein involved in Fe transport